MKNKEDKTIEDKEKIKEKDQKPEKNNKIGNKENAENNTNKSDENKQLVKTSTKIIANFKKINQLKEVDETYANKVYFCLIEAILVIAYFLIVFLVYGTLNAQYPNSIYTERFLQLSTMFLLFATIYVFEKAYRKDDDSLAITGIEMLILSSCTLTMQYIAQKYKFNFQVYAIVLSYIFAIYYVFKGIVIYTKGRKKIVDGYSDIKEIVQYDEPQKKEATKHKNDKIEKNQETKKEEEKETKNTKTKVKSKSKPKARTKTKTKSNKKETTSKSENKTSKSGTKKQKNTRLKSKKVVK